jgi:hypothetical protein
MPSLPDSPFTWPTAHAAGLRRSQLDAALAEGSVVRLLHGVYASADVAVDTALRAKGVALVVSPYSVVRDRTAAWLWGVECHEHAELDGTPPLETCVLRGHEPTDRSGVAGIVRDLAPEDWTDVMGVRVTIPVRTALDLGCLLRPHRALGAMDALMRRHDYTHEDMRVLMRRYRRRRGVVQLRRLVNVVDPAAESQPESWVRWFIIERELPVPTPQVWVEIEGLSFRLDLAYPRARIAVEYDGEEFHRTPEQRAHDARRRALLVAAGWVVIVVTKHDLAPERREQWLRELAGVLRQRRVAA